MRSVAVDLPMHGGRLEHAVLFGQLLQLLLQL
jgi:hypothetical protein